MADIAKSIYVFGGCGKTRAEWLLCTNSPSVCFHLYHSFRKFVYIINLSRGNVNGFFANDKITAKILGLRTINDNTNEELPDNSNFFCRNSVS